MSLPITHFSTGVTITLFAFVLFGRGNSVKTFPIALFVGFVAMIPDVWRFTWLPQSFHQHSLANVFILHQYLDTVIDPTDSNHIAALSVVLMGVMIMVVTLLQVQDGVYSS